jgi:hypothetical protein
MKFIFFSSALVCALLTKLPLLFRVSQTTNRSSKQEAKREKIMYEAGKNTKLVRTQTSVVEMFFQAGVIFGDERIIILNVIK